MTTETAIREYHKRTFLSRLYETVAGMADSRGYFDLARRFYGYAHDSNKAAGNFDRALWAANQYVHVFYVYPHLLAMKPKGEDIHSASIAKEMDQRAQELHVQHEDTGRVVCLEEKLTHLLSLLNGEDDPA